MKKLAASIVIVCALSLSVFAGDPGMPGKCEGPTCPPPCTENCGNGLTAGGTVKVLIAQVLLAIVTK